MHSGLQPDLLTGVCGGNLCLDQFTLYYEIQFVSQPQEKSPTSAWALYRFGVGESIQIVKDGVLQ